MSMSTVSFIDIKNDDISCSPARMILHAVYHWQGDSLLPPESLEGIVTVVSSASGYVPTRYNHTRVLVAHRVANACCILCSPAATIVGRILYNCLRMQATMHPRRPPMGVEPHTRSCTWNEEMSCQVNDMYSPLWKHACLHITATTQSSFINPFYALYRVRRLSQNKNETYRCRMSWL